MRQRRRGSSGKTLATAARLAAIQAAEKRRREEHEQQQEEFELEHQSKGSRKNNDNNNNNDYKTSTAKDVFGGDQYDTIEDHNIKHNNTHDDDNDDDNDDDDIAYNNTDKKNNKNSNIDNSTNSNYSNSEVGNKRKKFSLLQPFAQPYCKVVPEDQHHPQSCMGSNHPQQRSRKSGYKRKEDFDYSEEEEEEDDDDDEDCDDEEDSEDEGCLHCHRKVKHLPRIRVIEDDDDDDDDDERAITSTNHDDHDSLEGYTGGCNHGGSSSDIGVGVGVGVGSLNIQVRCDDCRGYICNGCHWCHEFQANHEIRVCDRCDAFYCRGCDEMDQCDDCGEVVCGSCSTLLSCKFCGGGLCEECATACGRCGIVLCSRDAKFAVECDTCRLSYCLVCLASGSKDPCVRCGHRPSKRMEQLVHLRLKSIYKAFKSSSSNANSNSNHNNSNSNSNNNSNHGSGGGGNSSNISGSGKASGSHGGGNLLGNSKGHGGRSRRNKPTTLQDMVGDHDDEDDDEDNLECDENYVSYNDNHHHNYSHNRNHNHNTYSNHYHNNYNDEEEHERVVDPAVSMMMGAAAGVLPHKFCHDLEQNYIAEQKKADAAAEALLAELEEEETAMAQKKSKKKKKKERKNAMKHNKQQQQQKEQQQKQQQQQHSSGDKVDGKGENNNKSGGKAQTKPSTTRQDATAAATNRESDPVDGDASSEMDSTDHALKDNNDDSDDKAEGPEEPKMDPVEKELVECVNTFDLEGIESILFRLKGVPGRAALRKNAKKALKRLKLELNPPPPTPPEPRVETQSKAEKKPAGQSSNRMSSGIGKVPVVVVDPKAQSKKSTTKSSAGHHDKSSYNNNSKSSHSKSSLHKTNSSSRCEAQVEIVSRLVGWMIGKNGQRIRDLMEESGAKIWIDQEKFKGQETRNVYISGDRKSVDHAVTLVNDVVINAPPPQGSAHATAAAAATAAMANMTISPKAPEHASEPVTLPVTVEVKSAWGKSTGNSAENTPPGTIPKPPALISSVALMVPEELQKEHSKAHVSSESPIGKEPPGLATNSSTLPAEATNPAGDPSLASNLRQKSAELTTEIVTCEARFVPLLIGKRGWTIKHIQDDSGARVDIDQSVTPRQVRISGVKANVDKAVTMVRDVLSYPHAQLQSSSGGVVDDVGTGLPGMIQEHGGSVAVSNPTQQKLLAASAVLERDATRNTISRQDENSDRIQSPPPMVGDAKSAISASSSLSSTPEPSMASSSKGFIPPHLQNGPLLPPPAEQYNMESNNISQPSPSPFLQPEGGITDGLGARGLWQPAGLGPAAIGTVAPQPLYTENTGQIGMQVGGQMVMPQIHQQLQQQNQHLQLNAGMILEQQQHRGNPNHQQQRLPQSFGPTPQISHGMTLPSNPNGSPTERNSQFNNQTIGNTQMPHNMHSTLGGGTPYNLYTNEGVPTARTIAATPLRDLMHQTGSGGGSAVSSPMRAAGFREGGNGLWNSGNPNYSSTGLPPQSSGLQPRSSSGFSAASMGFSSGQHQQNNESGIDNSFGYATSHALSSQHTLPHTNSLQIGSNESPHFSSVMPPVLRNDDSLMIDSLFGRTSGNAQTSNNTVANSLLTGFNGLALSSGGNGRKSSGLWDFTGTWPQNDGNTMHDANAAAPNVSSIGNIFADDGQDRPQESRFNWDSTNTNL